MLDRRKISTYQDTLNGREIEIDTLNLAVEKLASTSGSIFVLITGQMTKIKYNLFVTHLTSNQKNQITNHSRYCLTTA